MIKIMIAEDQQLIRESLKIILDSVEDYDVIATAENGEQVLYQIPYQKPDIILMDIRMPILDGVECTKKVKEKYPEIQVLILTTFAEDKYIENALSYGASGYVLKGVSLKELKDTIDIVIAGGSVLDPKVGAKMLALFSRADEFGIESELTVDINYSANDLSNREWRIISYIANGLSNKEIANKMIFTEGTIRNYLSIILEKLNLRDRTQLAIWYLKSGSELDLGTHEGVPL